MTNVAKINYCDQCDKPLVRGKACKNCNKTDGNEKQKVIYACCANLIGRRCNMSKGFIRINQDQNNPQFWCAEHYEKFRAKSDIEKRVDEGTAVFAEAIKNSGLTGEQFFREYCGYDVKDASKKISGVA